ncbi:MAG: 50S ribosomal protein L21e [Candidatus Pacearchaeota archaeon]|nr:50S ribosomal protein L21e [Candidatus Pacearchaeota archaeon]
MKSKKIRTRGKVKLSELYRNLKVGDKVALIRNLSEKLSFPIRMEGRTGTIEGKQGNAYKIVLQDFNEEKRFIIKPVHLRKIVDKK